MLPERFGRYEVEAEIGEGAMGRVYRAHDPMVRRVVAIKTVKHEYLTSETRAEYLKRFRREAQAAGGLSHPNIIGVYDVGDDYLVMEYLEGTTLQQLIRDRGRLLVADALKILAPVADALDHAHRNGIIHRDIKPANIMVLPDGRPKLMDFGVARVESSVMTKAGEVFGSPSYMAPEQIAGHETTNRADLFSLAVVAYETLTGHKPFEGTSVTTIIYKVVHEDAPPPRQYNLELPERYDAIFRRALAKDPADRYPTATAFIAALELKEVESALPVPDGAAVHVPEARPEHTPSVQTATLPPTEPMPAVPPRPRGAGAAAATVAGALLLAVLGWLVWPRPAPPEASASPLPASASPAPAPTELRIETDPEAATVSIDDKPAGVAPLSLPALPPGRHTVRIRLDGYAPAELTLESVAGTPMPPLRFVLTPIAARLSVRSEPGEASVKVDGAPAGTTPVERMLLTPGRHEVRVEKKGLPPHVERVEAKAGDELSVEAKLEAPRGGVRVSATPPPTPEPLREGAFVELGPKDTPPRRIGGAAVSYPEAARKLRLQGTVTVEMIVTETGEPTDIRVVESAGAVLDLAVLEAARSWRFEPAKRNGVRVKCRWRARETFVP